MSKDEDRASEAEARVELAVKGWTRNLSQVYGLVLPVIVNLLLTLSSWIFVYEMKADSLTVPLFLLDRAANLTTGSDVYDGMLNGVICVGSVGLLSFVMLTFALYDFRFLIQCWLSTSALVLMFCVSSTFFNRLAVRLSFAENSLVVVLSTLVYGVTGCFVSSRFQLTNPSGFLAFFTNRLPLAAHQFYVVCNCSLVSLFYLQLLPNHTTWFLLACIVLWDIFAVLTPIGPLRRVMGKAQDYSEDVLRFLMFTTQAEEENHEHNLVIRKKIDEKTEIEEPDQKDTTSDDCSTADQISDSWEADESTRETVESTTIKTAHDALNDSSARLGMGDFVFYGLLVGKAATGGSLASTSAAAIGVISGLIFTLTVWTDADETMPALPISIFFGMLLHFGTSCLVEPMLDRVLIL